MVYIDKDSVLALLENKYNIYAQRAEEETGDWLAESQVAECLILLEELREVVDELPVFVKTDFQLTI